MSDHINVSIDAPPVLKSSDHWVLRKGNGPVNKEGMIISLADPSFWTSFQDALDALQASPERFSGLGYIVQRDLSREGDQIIGGELDNCRDPITGWISPWAQSILGSINACTCISLSGCGLSFFCLGKLPEGVDEITGHGLDDLTTEARTNILNKTPEIKEKLARGEPAWNDLRIYERGPSYIALPGEWLPEYPQDLPNRTSELREVIAPFLKQETPSKPASDKAEPSDTADWGHALPFLSILQVIDTTGFKEEGDELVGPHPMFDDSAGVCLSVNLSKNTWRFVHEGSETGGDPWLWLACKCGAVAWEDCESGALSDESIMNKVTLYAMEEGYFKEDELFLEENPLQDAMDLISELKKKVLQDPGLPFEKKYVDALAFIRTHDQPEFERIKSYLKGKISWRDLSKLVKAASIKIADNEEPSQESSSVYISWKGEYPSLLTAPLLEDILTDLNARVIEGTEKDLAIYNPNTGTYDIGKSAMRLILKEAARRIKLDGDPALECISPQCLSKMRSLAPVLALEIGDEFEMMVSCICVGNGVVDLKTSHIIEWSPDWYMLQHSSIKYIPDKNWRELAPTFAGVLEKVFDGDMARMEYFQRYMGYCATGETIEDSILILIGVGGTGKSTLLDIVRKALGDGYVRVIKADLQAKAGASSARDGIARARYARMLIMKELEKENNLSWGTLKELASNSSVIEARKLYGGTENFHLLSKLIIDTNFMPKADDPDRSILRRIKPLPFRHIMTEEEKNPQIFNNIVKNELEGVLAWIVEGAKKWYESGLGNPAFIEEELSIYKTSMDTHLAVSWLEQSGYRVAHNTAQLLPEKWISSTSLYEEYRKYAAEGRAKIYGIQDFSAFLENRGARKNQTTRTINGEKERSTFWLNIEKSVAD